MYVLHGIVQNVTEIDSTCTVSFQKVERHSLGAFIPNAREAG